jgi:DNA repair protein RadC
MKRRIKEPFQTRVPISKWPDSEKPREKLLKVGAENLTSAELLAILISSGTDRYSAVDIGKELIRKFNNLENLSNASCEELEKIMGIGKARAVKLMASFQLSRNMLREIAEEKPIFFQNPGDVARVFIPRIGHLKQEVFVVAHIDSAGKFINSEIITRGTLDTSLVHPREVFKSAIKHAAASIVVLHNHPSGQLMPSREDIAVTNQLVDAGKMMDIPVQDHLIITRSCFLSMREEGYL